MTQTDGTRVVYAPVAIPAPIDDEVVWKWGVSSVVDTHGNTVTYTWDTARALTVGRISQLGQL